MAPWQRKTSTERGKGYRVRSKYKKERFINKVSHARAC